MIGVCANTWRKIAKGARRGRFNIAAVDNRGRVQWVIVADLSKDQAETNMREYWKSRGINVPRDRFYA